MCIQRKKALAQGLEFAVEYDEAIENFVIKTDEDRVL
jgi:hypothetical protein